MLLDETGLPYEFSLKSVHGIMLVLMILYEQQLFLSYKLLTSLLHLLIFILSSKNSKPNVNHVHF